MCFNHHEPREAGKNVIKSAIGLGNHNKLEALRWQEALLLGFLDFVVLAEFQWELVGEKKVR